jgi:hypothetical protein
MGVFSRRGTNVQYCQSWKDLTTAEMSTFSAEKTRAVCHLNKGHLGDHEDKILELAWASGGWPNAHLYPAKLRPHPQTSVAKKVMDEVRRLIDDEGGETQ